MRSESSGNANDLGAENPHDGVSGGQTSSTTVSLIVPPVVCHNLDPHTGIPFMPHMAAHLAGVLRSGGYDVHVLDSFGIQPNNRQVIGEFMLMGADEQWLCSHIKEDTSVCYIYCRTIAEFISVQHLIKLLREMRPNTKIAVFENIQAVTSYSLRPIAGEFLDLGCHVVVTGEPETRAREITERLSGGKSLRGVPGVIFKEGGEVVETEGAVLAKDLDSLPFPAWDLFQLEGYWIAGFAHAPAGKSKFLPILTSRGCPFKCTFCIAPSVNAKWRPRSAVNVVDEMEHLYKAMGVTDFHVSDLNPTVSEKRIRSMCREIIKRKLPITWKLAQGTKIETIKSEDTISLMGEAGCRFISFSPESGSKRLLEIMNKPFDHEHALKMVRRMNKAGIKSQAVFLAGVPGENKDDHKQNLAYARRLIAEGVDEISLVVFAPLPGAALADSVVGFKHYSQCTPSPAWRDDYAALQAHRIKMYLNFFFWKIVYHPRKFLREVWGIFSGNFETKMEMSLVKQAKLYALRYFPWMFRKLDAEALLRR